MNKIFYITAILLICFSGISIAQENNYLRITALDNNVDVGIVNNGKIKFVIYYSINGNEDWVEFDTTKTITLTNKNDYICFKGENTKLSTSGSKFVNFTFSKNVAASGSIMSLIDNVGLTKTIPANYFFCKLFLNCSTLVSAPDLTAETLTQNCYNAMFQGCTSLIQAPELNATTLAKQCYKSMFYGCTSLVDAPELNATSTISGCYSNMFEDCSSLKNIKISFSQWQDADNKSFTTSWLKNVPEGGVCIGPEDLDLKSRSQSSIPSSWFVNPHKVYIKDGETEYFSIENQSVYSMRDKVSVKLTSNVPTIKGYDKGVSAKTLNTQSNIEITKNTAGYYFYMPNEDVEISVIYTPKEYTITEGEYVKCDVKTATVESDAITFTVTDRTSDGYELNNVKIGSTSIPFDNYSGTFLMSDFAKDVTITAAYTLIKYDVFKDENITNLSKTKPTVKDTVRFKIKDLTSKGYAFKNILVNGSPKISQNLIDSVIMSKYICNIELKAEYEPITFTISTEEYITCNTKTATVESEPIPFAVTDRTSEGYELTKVAIGTKSIPFENYAGSFNMSDFAKDVTISATYTPIKYQITKDENISCRKTTATVEDEITFTIKNLSSSGLILSKVFVNSQEVSFQDYSASFKMSDYICNVNISAEYKPLDYKITTDPNITSDHQFASINDLIKINAKDLTSDGYELEKIFVNGSSVTFYKNFSNFLMSEYKSDVEITTQYKPISYKVKAGRYVFTDKNSATVNDTIFFSIDDLSEDGKIFEYLLVNGKQIDIKTFNDTIYMSDYISDITIEAVYSKYHYIKTDNNITEISHTTAQKDEQIQFKINPANNGYEPFVYVNSRRLFSPDSINYTFAMFDNDVDIYVDYQEIVVEEPETQEDNQAESEPEVIKKNRPKAINKIKVYPSLAKEGEIITISLENVDSEYFANSKIIIFDILGKSIKTFNNPQEISKIIMPKGLYKGVFISGDKKIRFDFAILK